MPDESPPPQSPRCVFVYGTLRQGCSNDITRLQPAARFVGLAQVAGILATQVHDAVAVAAQPLEVALQLFVVFRVFKQQCIREIFPEAGFLKQAGEVHRAFHVKHTVHKACRSTGSGHGALQCGGVKAMRQCKSNFMQVNAIDAQVKV